MILDTLYTYAVENSATLITTYLSLLLSLYLRQQDAQKVAINAYLKNLGNYIEHLMLPVEKSLILMKIQYAKNYGVNVECFPAKETAVKAMQFLYRGSLLEMHRQSTFYEIMDCIKSRFIRYDSLVSKNPWKTIGWKRIVKDAVLSYVFALFILSLQIINQWETMHFTDILLLLFVYAISAVIMAFLLPVIYSISYWVKWITHFQTYP